MAEDSLHTIPLEHNIDYHINTLLERLETIRKESYNKNVLYSVNLPPKRNMQTEIRTLEFWRSIISECLASFFYVFIVCGAAAGAGVGASVSSVLLATALASALTMATLTQCFLHISGAHINPAVSLALCITRTISPIRAAMYITAQCGGGIAGAALLYGVTVPGYQGNLQAAISHSASLVAWERFGVEFILTFIVVLSYFVSTDALRKYVSHSALSIGAAYGACSFVSMPYLNPARSLGPSFVLNKWENHWVYWFGPLIGGIASGIVYEYIFNIRRNSNLYKANAEIDSSSIQSDENVNYDDDVEKPSHNGKYQQDTYNRNQATGKSSGVATTNSNNSFCQNLYTAQTLTKFEQPEPLYGGTRSLYCRSPTLTRTNLNRSQSVYAKSNTAINREIIPRAGPLVPAQSLYPIRVTQTQQTQSSHLQNQNVQNQLQQRSENIYGIRGPSRQTQQSQQSKLPQQSQQHTQQQQQHHQSQIHHQHYQQQLYQQQQQQQQQHPNSQSNAQDSHSQQSFQPVYGSRQNPAPIDGSLKYERRPESIYGVSVSRNRGQSAQSDDSSYGSYHGGSTSSPPARNPNNDLSLMYASTSQSTHHAQAITSSSSMRTQSERKVTTPIVASQAPAGATCAISYSTNQIPTPPIATQSSQQHQQQQIVIQPQQNQHHQHYGMMSMRPT